MPRLSAVFLSDRDGGIGARLPGHGTVGRHVVEAVRTALRPAFALATSLPLAGCELIGNIFEAGVWTGIVLVVAILAGIVFLVVRLLK